MNTSKKEKDRRSLIAAILEKSKMRETLQYELESSGEGNKELEENYLKTESDLENLEKEYLETHPVLKVSRCPFTYQPLSISIDNRGLDGPWWNADQPIRNAIEKPMTFHSITGSVVIGENVPQTSFKILPGPDVPWVCPRLLSIPDVKAVLSYISIGNLDAYVTVYFAKDPAFVKQGINTLGLNYFVQIDENSTVVVGDSGEDEDDYDFEIEKWIKEGKLKWINKDDLSLELHDNILECPYLNLEGDQFPRIIRDNKMESAFISIEYEDELPSINFCPNCGSKAEAGVKYCGNCGQKLA